jgi:hypothetical protein
MASAAGVARFVVTLCCALLPLRSGAAQRPSRDWSIEDRTVIGDFSVIRTVAAASDRVFVTSRSALLIWLPHFERWEGPYLPPDPRLLEDVVGSLVDPLDNSLWLGRPDGWVHYEPELQLWTSGSVPGRVQGIAFDLASPLAGLLLQTSSGWIQVPRGGFAPIAAERPGQPLRPGSAAELLRTNPSFQALGTQFLLDGRLTEARLTAAARSFDRLGWYVGTAGVGLLYLREGAAIPDRLPFGVAGDRLTAVFAAPGGAWVASARTADQPSALSFVASDLSAFRTLHGPPATGLPFSQVRQMIGFGTWLWAATDNGVARIDPSSGRVQMIDDRLGLPDSRVHAIVARRGWVAVGTARGAARMTDSAAVIRIAPSLNDAVYAVAMSADTTWMGTGSGLYFTLSRDGDAYRPEGLGTVAAREPVIGLGWLGETLVALTPERVISRGPRGWKIGPELSTQVGRLRAFVPEGAGVWVAGERGAGFARLDLPIVRPLLIGDLPGDPRDIAVDADHLWIATSAGLVRFRRDAVRP